MSAIGNPMHPVTIQTHHEWHKIVALLMFNLGLTEFEVTTSKVEDLAKSGQLIMADCRGGGLVIRLVNEAKAEEMIKKERSLN